MANRHNPRKKRKSPKRERSTDMVRRESPALGTMYARRMEHGESGTGGDDPGQHERIAELRQQLDLLGSCGSFVSDSCPPGITEQFLRNVLAYETTRPRSAFDLLVDSGVAMPAPDELRDPELGDKLWEVIRALALLRIYLLSTDHLNDRELYGVLWTEVLRESIVMIPGDTQGQYFFDLVSSGSEEAIDLWLRYYADDETRKNWAKEWNEPLRLHERPPYDRDRLLPTYEDTGWSAGPDPAVRSC